MENTFNKVRDCILENGNSNFRKTDKSFSIRLGLETLNTVLLLEEKNDTSKITMSFFDSFEISENDYFAFRIEKEQNGYKLIGGTFDEDNNDIEIEIIEIESVLKVFENEIENLILSPTKEMCTQVFDNLYDNKIILRKGAVYFCEFLKCDFEENTLTIQLKIIEPVIKLKPRYKKWFEEAKNKEYIEIQYNFKNNETLRIRKQSIGGLYSSRIWANSDIVKKIYDLKEQGLEEEIYEILW